MTASGPCQRICKPVGGGGLNPLTDKPPLHVLLIEAEPCSRI